MAWSYLPVDLLYCILSQLPVIDFLRFSIVCTSWNSVFANNAHIRIHFHPSPWMLLPSNTGEASDALNFWDLTIKEEFIACHHHFSSLSDHIFGRRCIGSKDGSLVTLDKNDLQPRIFNRLTKAEISLPSLFTIPEDKYHRMKPEYASDGSIKLFYNEICPGFCTYAKYFRDVYFRKIIISSNDLLGTAIVIYGYKKLLALTRPGDRAWVLGPQLPPYHANNHDEFEDVYYHEEEQRFYAITHFSRVLAFDHNGQNVEMICPPIGDQRIIESNCMKYIFFLMGTLLKIERDVSIIPLHGSERNVGKTIRISVLKLVQYIVASSSSFSQWTSIKDFGNFSLFVGCNQTFSLHHTTVPEIRPNCIYFSDNWDESPPNYVNPDAGFFDLHNECFHHFESEIFNYIHSILLNHFFCLCYNNLGSNRKEKSLLKWQSRTATKELKEQSRTVRKERSRTTTKESKSDGYQGAEVGQ